MDFQNIIPVPPQLVVAGASGICSGAIACIISSPLSVLKAHGQYSNYTTFSKYFIDQKSGNFRVDFKTLMTGSRVRCCHASPFTAIQFSVYNWVKGERGGRRGGRGGAVPLKDAFVAGATAGAVATAAMFPLETLKTRKSYLLARSPSSSSPPSSSIVRMIREVVRKEGVRGLYRGLLTGSLLESVPVFGLTFMTFELAERGWGKQRADIRFHEHFISGCVASAFTQTFTFPLENIRKMVQTGYVPVGSAALVRRLQNPTWGSVVRSVISTSGVMGVWKGSTANLIANVPYTGLIFALFEFFWYYLNEAETGGERRIEIEMREMKELKEVKEVIQGLNEVKERTKEILGEKGGKKGDGNEG